MTYISNAQSVIEKDSLALVTIYNSMGGNNWTNNENWLNGPVDSWYGITIENNRVTRLILTSNNLTGSIPKEIADLDTLLNLRLFDNNLVGEIPLELYSLTELRSLYLNQNDLSGVISAEISNLTFLNQLNLSENNLGGTIPEELWDLILLNIVDLSHNNLQGVISPHIQNLFRLSVFDLSNNSITGEIPKELGMIEFIFSPQVYLDDNQLIGSIPDEIWDSRIFVFSVSGNNLSGSLSAKIGTSNIQTLGLDDNNFVGSIPPEISQNDLLAVLSISNNNFSGTIPKTFEQMSRLTVLRIADNDFEGDFPRIENLRILDISGNRFVNLPDLSANINTDFELFEFAVSDNLLTFEDLEPNASVLTDTPFQKPFGDTLLLSVEFGNELIIQPSIPGSSNNDTYQWYKDELVIEGETDSTLRITNFDMLNEGTYTLKIKNTTFPLVSIDSKPIIVEGKKVNQTVTFNSIDEKTFGDVSFTLNAFSSSGLQVSFSILDETVASINESNVSIENAGSTIIQAFQIGNEKYAPSDTIEQQLIVNKADQVISFDPLPEVNETDETFELLATSSSDLIVSFESSNNTIASIDGKKVSINSYGQVSITASQEGNNNFNPAISVSQILNIDQVLTVLDKSEILIYPNPAKEQILIDSEVMLESVHIFSLDGKNVLRAQNQTQEIDVSSLKNGVYEIVLTTITGEKTSEKLFIRR
jgi:hypothetical protein